MSVNGVSTTLSTALLQEAVRLSRAGRRVLAVCAAQERPKTQRNPGAKGRPGDEHQLKFDVFSHAQFQVLRNLTFSPDGQ
jgi:hypothetical protein